MSSFDLKKEVEDLLALADVKINGSRPWDLKVKNEDFYRRVLTGGGLAFGDSFIEGWWDCDALDELAFRISKANLGSRIKPFNLFFAFAKASILNLQSPSRAFEVGKAHYDLGDDLYSAMLDSKLTYTCGYWKNAKNLDEAQEAKLDLVCRKIGLKPGMTVLDIGCGWGSFAKYAAEKYNTKVVGITISKNQAEYAAKLCKNLQVEIRLQDYRQLNEKFDRVVSLGMFEHVGCKNYQEYMKIASNCLKSDDGLFLLHTIGGNVSTTSLEPWMEKHIFPNSMLPSIKQIGESIENQFVMEDWHNFGPYYDKTLMAWFENFDKNWPKLKDKYGDQFYRMWKFYLLFCAGTFRSRTIQLWQIVLSKKGIAGGYETVR